MEKKKINIKALKLNWKVISVVSIVTFIFLFTFIVAKSDKQSELVQASVDATLSNKKIGWGIKRNDNHAQPDLGKVNLSLIQKYNGIAMGNNEKKYVYLTFDNGYEAGYTAKILDTLKENNVSATFFVTAHYLNTAGDLVERMIKEGHIIRKSYGKS